MCFTCTKGPSWIWQSHAGDSLRRQRAVGSSIHEGILHVISLQAGAAESPQAPREAEATATSTAPAAGYAARRGLAAKHATRPRVITEAAPFSPASSLGRGTPRSFSCTHPGA